jgi:hypothetical protein
MRVKLTGTDNRIARILHGQAWIPAKPAGCTTPTLRMPHSGAVTLCAAFFSIGNDLSQQACIDGLISPPGDLLALPNGSQTRASKNVLREQLIIFESFNYLDP